MAEAVKRAGYLRHGLTRALRWTISSPVKVSGAAKIGPLKNLIWTSLAELSPGLRPISANLSRVFFFKLPQNRHPERSAAQIDRVTRRLWRGVEGPRRCFIYPCRSELFNHRSQTRFFPGAENAASACSTLKATHYSHSHRRGKTTQRLAARKEAQPHWDDQSHRQRSCTDLEWKMITVHKKMYPDHPVRIAADPVVGLRWSKSSEQHG